MNGLELSHKLHYTQTSFSDSAAWLGFEKECFLQPLKIHKKVQVLTKLKSFCCIFSQFHTKISLSEKHFWGYRHFSARNLKLFHLEYEVVSPKS